MEELLEREISNLKRQQALLEQELIDIDEINAHRLGNNLMDVNTLQPHTTTGVSIINTATYPDNTATFATTGGVASTAANIAVGVTGDQGIVQLDKIRRRYQREANRALRRYFCAVSDYPRYQANRERRLRSAQPFSFETRELMRSQRIHTRRMVEEQRKRDEELEKTLHHRFKASPVPPSTYMNKYDLMVEEWRQRKAAVEALAVEKAERIKEEAEWLRISTESLRHVREVMGVRRDKTQRAKSAGCLGRERRGVVELHEIPLEVKMRLWPALEEHEQIRNERIKQRAADRLKEMQTVEMQRASELERCKQQPPLGVAFSPLQPHPLVTLSLPQQQENQPQPQIAPMPSLAVPVGGPISALPTMLNIVAQPATTGIDISTVPAVGAVPEAGSVPAKHVVIAPPTAVKSGEKSSTDAVKQKPHSLGCEEAKAMKYNRNLTFKPKIRDGVPDFDSLWAKERLSLVERKRRLQTTEVLPFSLTASSKDSVFTGRRAPSSTRAASVTRSLHHCRVAANKVQRPSCSASRHTEGADDVKKNEQKVIPRGTRAHAMRTQAVFSKYVSAAGGREAADGDQNEFKTLQAAYQRQKMVNARLKEYLKGSQNDKDTIINEKVRVLRRQAREAEREAAVRLQEMRARVAQIPPIFVEPTHLHDTARARAETEKEIMQMLKTSGVDGRTLAVFLASRAGDGGDNGVVSPVAGTATAVEATTIADTAASGAAELGSMKELQVIETSTTMNEGTGVVNVSSVEETKELEGESVSVSIKSSSKTSIEVSEGSGDIGSEYDDDFEGSMSSSTVSG